MGLVFLFALIFLFLFLVFHSFIVLQINNRIEISNTNRVVVKKLLKIIKPTDNNISLVFAFFPQTMLWYLSESLKNKMNILIFEDGYSFETANNNYEINHNYKLAINEKQYCEKRSWYEIPYFLNLLAGDCKIMRENHEYNSTIVSIMNE
jgi:hypothetical protein